MKILCLYLLLSCLDQLNASTWGYTDWQYSTGNTSHQINRCQVPRVIRTSCGYQFNTSEQECTSLGCCWDPTHDELENTTHCYHMTAAPSEFKPDAIIGNETFCGNGEFLIGDVNADRYSDQFCFNDGELKIRLGDLTDPYKEDSEKTVNLDGCNDQARFQIGDVNGDGRSDLICSVDGIVMVWESKHPHLFSNADYWKDDLFEFCLPGSRNIMSDFNGDGMVDALCVSNDGRTLALGDAAGTFLAKIRDPNFDDFCTKAKDKIYVGDFDADGRSDLVCKMERGEKYQIALADGDGFLVNEDFETVQSWCDKDDDTFLVADTNGDKHDDWVCHHGDGSVCTKYNSHIFGAVSMFANETETCDAIGWCGNGDVIVGELNGDGMDDMFCRKDNKISLATSTIKAPLVDFIQVDWNSTDDWGTNFCEDKEIYPVDLNNDQREDVVCHDYKGGIIQTVLGDHYGRLVESSLWDSSKVQPDPFRFCHIDHQNPEKPQLLTGDVDGDGKIDLLCVHIFSGNLIWTKPTVTGSFGQVTQVKKNFCQGKDKRVFITDFDDDNKADVACGSKNEWKILMHLEENQVSKTLQIQWCTDLNSEVLVGRFMNGKTTELMCQNRESGEISVLYLEKDNQLATVTLELPSNWCLSKNSQALKAGDLNGDSLTDLLCHKQTGELKVLIRREVKKGEMEWFGQEFQTTTDFCLEIGSKLIVYDANGDGYDDLTCHTSQGEISISESHLVDKNQWPPLNPDDYYPLNDLNDLTWNKYNTVNSTPPDYAFSTSGKVGKAVEVNAANEDWIQLDRGTPKCLSSTSCTEGFSMAFWLNMLKCDGNSFHGVIGGWWGNRGCAFACKSDHITIEYFISYSHKLFKSPLPIGTWNHVTVTFNPPSAGGAGVALYINGNLMVNKTYPGLYFRMADVNFKLGKVSIFYGSFLMDELLVWDRKLSEQEVATLYTSYE